MTITPTTTIKRGDAVTLTLNLSADLTDYATARVHIGQPGRPAADLAGTIADAAAGIVTVDLTSDDTATAGTYRLEVELRPGPHTWPSSGWVQLVIDPDIA